MTTAFETGKISCIVVTFNGSKSVRKSIDSLLNQTYKNLEIIVIDNGSTDDTQQVLQQYKTTEFQDIIRIFRIEVNRQYMPAANKALGLIRGEWFTFLDDDDYALPEAFETMMKVVTEVDPKIDAVTCNCIDSSTREFSGRGFNGDQYLSFEDMVRNGDNEFWGITKTKLLGDKRINESLRGFEDTFWYKVSAKANRYYVDQALRVWNTEGATITNSSKTKDLKIKSDLYRAMADESFYWKCLSDFRPQKFRSKCFNGLIYMLMDNDRTNANKYRKMLTTHSSTSGLLARFSMLVPPAIIRSVYKVAPL